MRRVSGLVARGLKCPCLIGLCLVVGGALLVRNCQHSPRSPDGQRAVRDIHRVELDHAAIRNHQSGVANERHRSLMEASLRQIRRQRAEPELVSASVNGTVACHCLHSRACFPHRAGVVLGQHFRTKITELGVRRVGELTLSTGCVGTTAGTAAAQTRRARRRGVKRRSSGGMSLVWHSL